MYTDGILVLDFGGIEGRAIARRMRGEQVFCTVMPVMSSIDAIRAQGARGIIIAGGGRDAFAEGAPRIPAAVYELGLPMLGVGYGARALLRDAGAVLKGSQFGVMAKQVSFDEVPLFRDLTTSDRAFSRLDDVELPDGFIRTAVTDDGCCAAFENAGHKCWGMQFCPEANDPDGLLILRNFARGLCGAEPNWNMASFLDWSLGQIRHMVGDRRALVAISGGVDSAVCAALVHRAVGEKLVCVHVDTGLMRAGEREQVQHYFVDEGIGLRIIDAQARFLEALDGLTSSDEKRGAVYREYGRVVQEVIDDHGEDMLLAQGIIYPDILDEPDEWAHARGHAIEPIKMLFKDEVRELGALLGLPKGLVNRQAFPGPGLALRCAGAISAEKIAIVRRADQIFRDEVVKAGLDKRVRQYFAVLAATTTKGHDGNYGHTVALRAVNADAGGGATAYRMPYDLLERVCERLVAEVTGVNRVTYDITGVPPALVEWE